MAEETNHKPYRLGLALSGGGAKGFAHIGVFRMMEECALRPDIIVGTRHVRFSAIIFRLPIFLFVHGQECSCAFLSATHKY